MRAFELNDLRAQVIYIRFDSYLQNARSFSNFHVCAFLHLLGKSSVNMYELWSTENEMPVLYQKRMFTVNKSAHMTLSKRSSILPIAGKCNSVLENMPT